MTITCGTDFSPAASAAATTAAQLAARSGSTLELACGTEVRTTPSGEPETARTTEVTVEAAAARMEAEVARLRALGVAVTGRLDATFPDHALLGCAERDDVQLLVLGAVGHGMLERALLGSVAEQVAMRSSKPVLVVRDDAPWRAWGAGERALRVLVGFDPGPSAASALEWAVWLSSLGEVQLTLCWVVHPAMENERFGAVGEGAGIELLPKTKEDLWFEFERLVEAHGPFPSMELHLEPNLGRIDSALSGFAQERGHDVIVVGSHQRHGFERLWEGSVSRGVLRHSPVSVVVVPHH